MGRLLGKSPKKGSLITINAVQKGDSLRGNVEAPLLGKMKFKGIFEDDILSGELVLKLIRLHMKPNLLLAV